MPLTSKGAKIMKAMKARYGEKKGEQVYFASKNAGTITGVEQRRRLALEAARLRTAMFPHLARPGR
ncbi:MAG TPA: hypothetical protein VKE94_14695 [Gemmataceae bacterium]|nr:hypothetical protein [Gemmataceae bacterium]